MKFYLTLSLSVVSLMSAILLEGANGISPLSRAEAAAIEGAVGCPYVPMNPEQVCENLDVGTCSGLYFCSGGTCGVNCGFAVSKRSGPTWIKTTPSLPAVESATKNCSGIYASGSIGTCKAPFNPFANCYCGSPWTPAACAGTYTDYETCN